MKTRFWIIFTLVMLPLISESYAEEIEINFGETVFYENLKLYFYDIENSRCPSDVTCIWEGKVAAMIHYSNQTHKIGGPHEIGYTQTYITPFEITLIDVSPYPISTEKPDYVAILKIEKSESSSTDEQVCGVGFVIINEICMPSDIFRVCNPSFVKQDFQTCEAISHPEVMIIIESLGAILIVSFIVIYAIKKRRKK